MSSLRRAWTTFWSRPGAERAQLLRRAVARLRSGGLGATLAWARAGGAVASQGDLYEAWCRLHTPDGAALARMRGGAASFHDRPLISIITAAYNTAPALLVAAADSVLAQAYTNWEWHIADDGSTDPASIAALDQVAGRDVRIHVHRAPANGGISAASNLALSHARGEYVALMDHDDALLPHALYRIVESLNGTPADVVYSDEDKLDLDGRRCDPYFKPDWAPDLFRSSMYACHLLVIRRSLVSEAGGFRSAFDFSQDYDLLLRVIERTDRIAHVPDVLYHWRKTPASTALAGETKPAAHGAGARALQAHLDRQEIGGRVLDAGPPGLYRIKYDIAARPLVSIVMPTRDPADPAAGEALAALSASTQYSSFEVLLVSRAGTAPRRMPGGMRVQAVRASGAFSLAEWMNDGARAALGSHLLFLHDDARPLDGDWLDALLELSLQPWIGAVGAKLFAPDGSLQHIGLVLGLDGLAGSPYKGHAAGTLGYYSSANCIRNYSAVSGACLMTRREVFERVGGFDADLTGPGSDVDYGLRVTGAGLRVVYTPYARLVHRASGGVSGRALTAAEREHLERRWGWRLSRDPYYNPNLTTRGLDYQVKVPDGWELVGPVSTGRR